MGRLEDQPEYSAGVRPTEGNIPAHLSHQPERTAQHLFLLRPWSTAPHEPGVPRPSDLLTSSGTRSPGLPIANFCASPLMLVARPPPFAESVRFVFLPRAASSMHGATLPTGWTSARTARKRRFQPFADPNRTARIDLEPPFARSSRRDVPSPHRPIQSQTG